MKDQNNMTALEEKIEAIGIFKALAVLRKEMILYSQSHRIKHYIYAVKLAEIDLDK